MRNLLEFDLLRLKQTADSEIQRLQQKAAEPEAQLKEAAKTNNGNNGNSGNANGQDK